MRLPAIALLAGALLVIGKSAPAAEPLPLAGKWLFKDVSGGNEVSLALIEIEEKDGKPVITTLAAPLLGGNMDAKKVKIDARSINFEFDVGNLIVVNVAAAKDDKKPKVLRGILQVGSRKLLAELERTELKELTRQDALKPGPATEILNKAKKANAADRAAGLKEVIEKYSGSGAAYAAAEALFRDAVKEGVKEEALRAATDRFINSASPFGADIQKTARAAAARTLVKAEKVSPLAVEFARNEEKALSKEDSQLHTVSVLKMLETALRKTGKTDEAKTLQVRIDKMDHDLDAEFEKTSMPFKPEPFKGRKGKSTRVAVVELFTGSECPPCVSADIAFDAAVKSLKPTDAVFLEYHLHIPRPDPLTNADSEKRQKYYRDSIRGTPTAFVNGKATRGLGGLKQHGEDRYDTLKGIIEEALEAEDQASLKLTAVRKGDKIDVSASVKDLKKTGEMVRLRFVLIEDEARYQGGNGQRLHHHVVRAFPGGMDGFPLKEATADQTVKVSLDDLRRDLKQYLDKAEADGPFRSDDWPLKLKSVKIIALIQDDESKEILQAAQIDVPETK
jgi:hypothetical protein